MSVVTRIHPPRPLQAEGWLTSSRQAQEARTRTKTTLSSTSSALGSPSKTMSPVLRGIIRRCSLLQARRVRQHTHLPSPR